MSLRHNAQYFAAVLVVLSAIFIGFPVFLERFTTCHSNSPVSRAKSNMRSLATAIESYYVDHNAYPAMRPLKELCVDHPEELVKAGGDALTAIEPGGAHGVGLTTPVAYITPGIPMDARFRNENHWSENVPARWMKYAFLGWEWRKAEFWPYAYHTDGKLGWIVWSTGPDNVYDITDPKLVYDPTAGISPALVSLTYDPTNGAGSRGDVYRIKQ